MGCQLLVIVCFICFDGICGIGEVIIIGGLSYGVESFEVILLVIIYYLMLLLKGQLVDNLNVLIVCMNGVIKGNIFVKFVIEIVLFDVQGKVLGLLVLVLFGGVL